MIEALSAAAVARGTTHGVVLMVELGDLREGILPADLADVVAPDVAPAGHRAARASAPTSPARAASAPTTPTWRELSDLAGTIEAAARRRARPSCRAATPPTSTGRSPPIRRRADQRPAPRRVDPARARAAAAARPIDGLHTDAFTLVAEVIESKVKPTGRLGDHRPDGVRHRRRRARTPGSRRRVLVALGRQDVDPDGLTPPAGMTILGASSDHLVLDAGSCALPGGHRAVASASTTQRCSAP